MYADSTDFNANDSYTAFKNFYDGNNFGDGRQGISLSLFQSEVSPVLDLGTSTDVRDDRFAQIKVKQTLVNPIFIPMRTSAERTSVFNSSKFSSEDEVEFRRGPTAEDPVYPAGSSATGTKFPGVRLLARKLPRPGDTNSNYLLYDLESGAGFTKATRTSGGGDDGYYSISLPFTFAFGPNNYTEAHVGSNGYVTFGAGSVTYSGISVSNPPLPKICIGAGDNSTDNVYYKSVSETDGNGNPIRTIFVIYFRGTGTTGYAEESVNSSFDNLIRWEMYFYSNNPGVVDVFVKNMPAHRTRWSSSSSGGFSGGVGYSGANHAGSQDIGGGVLSPVGKGACTFTVGNDEYIRIKNIGQQVYRMTAGIGSINGNPVCTSVWSGSPENAFPPTSGYYNATYAAADACPSGWTDMTSVNTPQAYQYPTFQAGGWLLPSGTADGHVKAVTDPNDYIGDVGEWRVKSNNTGNSYGYRDGAPYEYTSVTKTAGWGARIYWGWGCDDGGAARFYLAATVRYCVPSWSNTNLFG